MTQHTPLDPTTLSASAQRALGPGPGKMMAARGIMPLTATDQVAVLYQLALDAETSIADTAKATASGLPDKVLVGAMSDPHVDPRVLDFFAIAALDKPAVFEAIITNASVADTTIATVAGRADAKQVDLIATNESRILRHPEIIAAMYMNRRARMSTIDRVVELAIRQKVKVPGLFGWDEMVKALTGAPPAGAADDAAFESGMREANQGDVEMAAPNEDGEEQPEEAVDEEGLPVSISARIRMAMIGNNKQRDKLIRDRRRGIYMAAVSSPLVKDADVLRWSSNQNLNEEVIRTIAQKREWLNGAKGIQVKAALCRNPKTPVPDASRMLPFLREKDLQALAKSKGVSAALVSQAKKLLMARSGTGNKK
jgi:hypothetical protein